jgi:hypothetical protein
MSDLRFQNSSYHPETVDFYVSRYRDPDTSSELVYVFSSLSYIRSCRILYIYFYVLRSHDLWYTVAKYIIPMMDDLTKGYDYN